MGLFSTSEEATAVRTTHKTKLSLYAMEILQQRFVLLALYIISQVVLTMSHAIGVTDFYLSIWAVVDATNRCPSLNFQFPTTESECR